MRLMITALLLASAAVAPAIAQDHPQGDPYQNGDHRGGDHRGGDRQGGRGNGGDPQARPQGGPQGQPQGRQDYQPHYQPNPQQGQQRPQGDAGGDRGNGQPQGDAGHHVSGRPDNGVQVWRNERPDQRGPDARSNGPYGQGGRPGGWNGDNRPDGRPGGYDGRGNGWNGDHGRPGGWNQGGGDRGGWNNGWRNDRRYDWQGWRNAHRDTYRVGRYRAPYGYYGGYRRWGIGVRVAPMFFAQDYWIDNPGYYRLPPAYGAYRWVRYYNDALLIDIGSGYVVDEIPNFFW